MREGRKRLNIVQVRHGKKKVTKETQYGQRKQMGPCCNQRTKDHKREVYSELTTMRVNKPNIMSWQRMKVKKVQQGISGEGC